MSTGGNVRFVDQAGWKALLKALARTHQLLGPEEVNGRHRLAPADPETLAPGPARMVDPLKTALFPAREDLGPYFGAAAGLGGQAAATAVVGVAACDLAALPVLDFIFLEGPFVDPQYRRRRDATFIVSHDCTRPFEVCFCVGVGDRPYPRSGFDLNVSEVEGGMVAESGSDRGRALLDEVGARAVSAAQAGERDRRRQAASEAVGRQAAALGLPRAAADLQKAVLAGVEHPVWKRQAEKCVECGACNFICSTCHCFLLTDVEMRNAGGGTGNGSRNPPTAVGGKSTGAPTPAHPQSAISAERSAIANPPSAIRHPPSVMYRRFKHWDACQYENFARVAGGANPRRKRWQRLRNRFEKKFDFFVTHTGRAACTGCGRCVEACPGKIDLREVLKELVHA